MDNRHATRFGVIAAVLIFGILGMFWPPQRLWDPQIHPKHNLRAGIDISGGVSLLYEIKPPPNTLAEEDLASKVAEALKKRVDPDGVKNLVWRPQGSTRLEIQMPIREGSEQALAVRQDYAAARDELERTNLRMAEINAALAETDPQRRKERIEVLAMGYPLREKLMTELGEVRGKLDRLRAEQKEVESRLLPARAKRTALEGSLREAGVDPAELAAAAADPDEATRGARIEKITLAAPTASAMVNDFVRLVRESAADEQRYAEVLNAIIDIENRPRELEEAIQATNLRVIDLESLLATFQEGLDKAAKNPQKLAETRAKRDAEVAKLAARFEGFARRLAAIEHVVAAHDKMQQFKGAVGDAEDLKRLLRGS